MNEQASRGCLSLQRIGGSERGRERAVKLANTRPANILTACLLARRQVSLVPSYCIVSCLKKLTRKRQSEINSPGRHIQSGACATVWRFSGRQILSRESRRNNNDEVDHHQHHLQQQLRRRLQELCVCSLAYVSLVRKVLPNAACWSVFVSAKQIQWRPD